MGAYSESQGFGLVRQQVADFITARDGIAAEKDDIFLTDGASKGVGFLLTTILRGSADGMLVPIPQYPLYSASLALQDAHLLGYELDEDAGPPEPLLVAVGSPRSFKSSFCSSSNCSNARARYASA